MCLLLFTCCRCFVLLGSLTRSCLESNMRRGQNSVPVELRINNFWLLKELLNSLSQELNQCVLQHLSKYSRINFQAQILITFPQRVLCDKHMYIAVPNMVTWNVSFFVRFPWKDFKEVTYFVMLFRSCICFITEAKKIENLSVNRFLSWW
jgi:hypothetical protein